MILIILLLVGLLVYAIVKKLSGDPNYWPKKGVPFVKAEEIFTLKDRILVTDPLHEGDKKYYTRIKQMNKKFGGVMEFGNPALYAVDLNLIKHIMVKDFEVFINRRQFDASRHDKYQGKMLFFTENQDWKDLRSTMSPTFTTGKIKRMFEIFDHCSSKFVHFLHEAVKESNDVEMKDMCGKITLDVIASTAFGIDGKIFEDANSEFHSMAKRFQNVFGGLWGVVKVILFFAAPKLFTLLNISISDEKSSEYFAGIVRKTISHRQQTGSKRDDFLQLLMEVQSGQLKDQEAENENDSYDQDASLGAVKVQKVKITDDILTANALLFFIAGFDTSETLLTFCLYELALNPEVQEKLAQEIIEAMEENDGKLTYEMINKMEYLDKVVSETLRKWPPVVRNERRAVRDYQLPDSDVVIPKGTNVYSPVWSIHYDPEYYPDPEKFDPERFTKENQGKRHTYAYMPFGAGPRMCIARRFALVEGKTNIAKLVKNFVFEPCSKTHIPMKFPRNGFMKPDGGMWLNVKSRNTIEE